MPESKKPLLHLEGQVVEAEVRLGGTPPQEFRRVKIGNLRLSCWAPELYPFMVEGKYLAVNYTATKRETARGTFTNYNIQEATEVVAPKPGTEPTPVLPLSGNGPKDSRESSIEAQVAAYCTAQVMAATIQYGEGGFELHQISELIVEFYRGMQRAKQTGTVAESTEATPNSPTPKAATPSSEPVPTEDTPFPEASTATAPPKPKEADIAEATFWVEWRKADLPVGSDLPQMIERITGGRASTLKKALDSGWTRRELLEAAKVKPG